MTRLLKNQNPVISQHYIKVPLMFTILSANTQLDSKVKVIFYPDSCYDTVHRL